MASACVDIYTHIRGSNFAEKRVERKIWKSWALIQKAMEFGRKENVFYRLYHRSEAIDSSVWTVCLSSVKSSNKFRDYLTNIQDGRMNLHNALLELSDHILETKANAVTVGFYMYNQLRSATGDQLINETPFIDPTPLKGGDFNFICEICARFYTTVYGLRRHYKKVHKLDDPPTIKGLKCPKCSQRFEATNLMKVHLERCSTWRTQHIWKKILRKVSI